MEQKLNIIRQLAEQYNKEEYFTGDPIIFPKHFARMMGGKYTLKDYGELLVSAQSSGPIRRGIPRCLLPGR